MHSGKLTISDTPANFDVSQFKKNSKDSNFQSQFCECDFN